MKVLQAEFVTSAAAAGRADDVPADGIAQVAFAGRSNVGKSTLLNALAARTLARTSAAPGKTRLANIYRLQVEGGPGGPGRWSVYFVDLPGYGYARGGADSAEELARVAAVYFSTRDSRLATRSSPEHSTSGANEEPNRETPDPASREPRAANREWEPAKRSTLLLIDSRHPGLPSDLQAHRWLTAVAGAPQIVATKIDKLSRAERRKNLGEIERVLGGSALPVSAAGGEGLDELWKLIARVAREPRR